MLKHTKWHFMSWIKGKWFCILYINPILISHFKKNIMSRKKYYTNSKGSTYINRIIITMIPKLFQRWLINFFIVGVNLLCLMISSIFYKHLSTVEDTITYGTKYDTQICMMIIVFVKALVTTHCLSSTANYVITDT